MRGRVLLPFALLSALAGCLEAPGGGAPAGTDDVPGLARTHLDAILSGDVDRAVQFDHDPWVDLGGGDPCADERGEEAATNTTGLARAQPQGPSASSCTGDGANVTKEERRAMYARFFASDEFDAMRGRSSDELLAWEDAAFDAFPEGRAWEHAWFTFLPGDVRVQVPPREGSPLFDGWFRIYRPIDGAYLSIAGD